MTHSLPTRRSADLLAAAQIAAIEPQGLARQPGEEGAIVTDDDERARKARQPVLEPFDRGEIEMVGRLIEQQYVGILRQRARDRGAAALTARGSGSGAREIDTDLIGDRFGRMALGRVIAAEGVIEQ